MGRAQHIWTCPAEHLTRTRPDHPVVYVAPARLQAAARQFIDGFPGQVTYAVKANPAEIVLANLAAAGIAAFDVASPSEMALVRGIAPGSAMHYNNPVRSNAEIVQAVTMGVTSYAVDSDSELDKLIDLVPAGAEVSVRFKLPVAGAAYDFGSKFGLPPSRAAALLRRASQAGFRLAMTFHPGTQCTDPGAWATYIHAAARIAREAGLPLARLNVGGGFPSHRLATEPPRLTEIFQAISDATNAAFGQNAPRLLCEPGRALVAEGFTLAARVKAIRDGRDVFLNDGIYGGLAEVPVMGLTDRITVLDPRGRVRLGAPVPRPVFGPTCDSLDRLADGLALPQDLEEGDYVLFHGLGAYSTATATRFNGYGALKQEVVMTQRG
ncbi:type III PLP-dependent enzyme [Actibacterium sp. XHP0104]|uniref:type III PLP-dependent enzyme n=1 Tax=Actibacterium sp. XHP0104 TaxID=2984335 RepID=UPI0021E92E87|nr:type III PLP-dependent enzyme [Actibacterium sp. XHP0104]MCV2881291.1 type III PLP-dependent enzyme [Actibacterium sp. XHP0104]